MKYGYSLCIIVLIFPCGNAWADQVLDTRGSGVASNTLPDVPAYNWYHGCGPTAAASVIGYHDLNGFDNLFTATGWDEVRLTGNVQDQISSPEHNAKYDPTPDNDSLPEPPFTSIADWFQTSVDPMEYGWSHIIYADDAFEGYINYRGYQCNSWYERFGALTWEDLVLEIDAGRPMMFLIDTDGDDETDHFVPVLGYDDRGDNGKYYACYTTWSESETVSWREFQGMDKGASWGISEGIFVLISDFVPGDFNMDGDVDVSDLGILATNYGTASGMGWEDGDANGDEAVDVSDLGVLASNYGTSDTAAAAIPEPAGLTLLLMATSITCFLRRR